MINPRVADWSQRAARRTADRTRPSLKEAVAAIPAECYANPTWRGMAIFARDWTMYLAAVVALMSNSPLLVLPAWILAGMAMSGLFVIGHDAAHGALFRSPRLNYWIAQLSLLPSLHAIDVWAYGHNRVHHTFAGCQGRDFVWHPVTRAQYADLPLLGKLLHRIEWSVAGAGVYYLRAIWWGRILHAVPPARLVAAFRRDRLYIAAYAVVAVSAVALVAYAATQDAAAALWAVVKVLVVPWIIFNYVIGATIYVHHIAPHLPWWPRRSWTKFAGQMDSTGTVQVAGWLNFLWHNIYIHVPHHVDPRIPFYHLPEAAAALARTYPDRVHIRTYGARDYLRTTRQCKLYDFERGRWSDYRGTLAVP